jgi:hypothetical protein
VDDRWVVVLACGTKAIMAEAEDKSSMIVEIFMIVVAIVVATDILSLWMKNWNCEYATQFVGGTLKR